MRITFRLSKEEEQQLTYIQGKTTSDKVRRAIKLAYIQSKEENQAKTASDTTPVLVNVHT